MKHEFLDMGTWEENKTESSWKMSEFFGQGSIKMIRFRSGMFLSFLNRSFNHRIKTYGQSNEGFIGFHFCLAGSETLKVSGVRHDIPFHKDTHGFTITSNGWQWQTESPAEKNVSIVSIGLTPAGFRDVVYDETEKLPSILHSVCEGKIPKFENVSINSTSHIRLVLEQMIHSHLYMRRRLLYFEAKSLELIDLILESFNRIDHCNSPVGRFRPSEIDRLYYVMEIMQKDLSNPPSLSALAKIAGMNHCKLNRGFKTLFGNTVFGCLREMRLEKARQLLNSGDMNVTEVSYFVGYSCLSHFAKAFKEKYHITPRSCLK